MPSTQPSKGADAVRQTLLSARPRLDGQRPRRADASTLTPTTGPKPANKCDPGLWIRPNIEHPTLNGPEIRVRRWTLDVGRSMLDVQPLPCTWFSVSVRFLGKAPTTLQPSTWLSA